MTKDRFDADGNPVTLDRLCKLEPEWAANRIRSLEAELEVKRIAEGALADQLERAKTLSAETGKEIRKLRDEVRAKVDELEARFAWKS